MTENKGNHDASHDLRGDGCEKLPHGRTLLSEACPTAIVTEKRPAVIRWFPLDGPRRPGVKEKSGKRANAPRSKPGQSSEFQLSVAEKLKVFAPVGFRSSYRGCLLSTVQPVDEQGHYDASYGLRSGIQ